MAARYANHIVDQSRSTEPALTGPIHGPCAALRSSWGSLNVFLALALIAVTLVVYIPAMQAGFIWNDDEKGSLIGNIVLQEHGLYRVWFTTESINYWPVVWTSYWLEHRLWGLHPTGYHVVNVLLHAANALLIWRILCCLKIPGPWLAAIIFAVHPVNVESVAWITQRKNTLCLLFFLLALLSYFRFEDREHRGWYGLAMGTFVLAMLSKGAAAPLPIVLLLCAWWRRDRIRQYDLIRSLPFFAVAALISLVEIRFQYLRAIGEDVVRDDSFLSRLAGAGWVIWFYVYKALLPFHLSFVYRRWQIDPVNWLSYLPGLLLLGLLLLGWRYRRNWGRPILFALGYSILMLLPVLGFFNIYYMKYSFVADHYQYLSIIGVITLAVAALWQVAQQFVKIAMPLAGMVSLLVVAILGWLTWQQSSLYQDSETIWRDTLEKNPSAWMAHNNLGIELEKQGKSAEAIEQYGQALKIKPDHAKACSNLGTVLLVQGNLVAAIPQFQRVIELLSHEMGAHDSTCQPDPTLVKAHNNLAIALLSKGRTQEALKHFREAIRLEPDHLRPLKSIAWTLATHPDSIVRNAREAVALAERAAKLTGSQDASILDTLAAAYAASGHFDLAVSTAERAIALAQHLDNEALARDVQLRLSLYRQEQPYRDVVEE